MRKRVVVFLVGLCFFIPVFSRITVIGHATTNENRAVVSFYQEEEPTQPDLDDPRTLPQTGSTFSYIGMVGLVIVFVMWYLKNREKKCRRTN